MTERLTHWPEEIYPGTKQTVHGNGTAFTLANAAVMAWASQLAYEVGDTPAEKEKVARVLHNWGWTSPDLCVGALPGAPWLRSTRGFIAGADNATIVAFSGTEPTLPGNWLTNIAVVPDPAEGIHHGFLDGVTSVWDKLEKAARAHLENPENRLYITGHSLGGALAVVAAFRLFKRGMIDVNRTRIVTFGMPRAGVRKFSDNYQSTGLHRNTFRLTHGQDLVPEVPPYGVSGFRHVGNLLSCDRAGHFRMEDLINDTPERAPRNTSLDLASVGPALTAPPYPGDPAAKFLPWKIRDHLTDSYLRALGALL